MKLIWSILVLIPILGPILYLWQAGGSEKERMIALIAIIPFANFVCAVILILSELKIVNL